MKMVYSLLGSIITVLALYLFAIPLINIFYIGTLPDEGPGIFPGLRIFLSSLIVLPVLILLFFGLYIIFYKKMNLQGLIYGGIIGLWLFSVLMELSPLSIYYYLPLIATVACYFLVKPSRSDQVLNWTLLGTIFGWIITYLLVIVIRAVQNSLTSYFNFDPSQKILVFVGILLFGISGWFIGKRRTSS
ncbi:hypothetical protein [Paenibacillus sp. MABNR03]|uniref:hypothetical protein n=1 Tax=Paenibacillus sp. MABNR03 TaxID=3142626 RepID=UPI003D2CB9C6